MKDGMDHSSYRLDIRKSNRKTLALEIKEPGVLIVRAPILATNRDILQMLESHAAWIDTHMKQVEERAEKQEDIPQLKMEEIEHLAERALAVIPPKVKEYAAIIGVTYGRITIRNQRTRWGSCSSKGNLNFNCLLMLAPEEVLDYVIVHELCHRIEMNHSQRFWALVERVLPDYKQRKKWLDEHGAALMKRMG